MNCMYDNGEASVDGRQVLLGQNGVDWVPPQALVQHLRERPVLVEEVELAPGRVSQSRRVERGRGGGRGGEKGGGGEVSFIVHV